MSAADTVGTPPVPSDSANYTIGAGRSGQDCRIQATSQAELDARDAEKRQSRKDALSAAGQPGTYFEKLEKLVKTVVRCGIVLHCKVVAASYHAALAAVDAGKCQWRLLQLLPPLVLRCAVLCTEQC